MSGAPTFSIWPTAPQDAAFHSSAAASGALCWIVDKQDLRYQLDVD
jgi:hypothetical protein